ALPRPATSILPKRPEVYSERVHLGDPDLDGTEAARPDRARRGRARSAEMLRVAVDAGRHHIRPKCRSASSIASRFSGGHGSISRARRAPFPPRSGGMPRTSLT